MTLYAVSAMSLGPRKAKSLSLSTARSPRRAASMMRLANNSFVSGVGSLAAAQAAS
jgi:hypothetical protein